jgi:phage-related minor tail protein
MSSFSNSAEEESQKHKNLEYTDDANIVQQASQMDEEMQEESCMSHTDNGKKAPSDLDGDQFTNGEQIKGEERKIKESKNKKVLKRKKSKRNYEEYSNTDVKSLQGTGALNLQGKMKIRWNHEALLRKYRFFEGCHKHK